MGLDIDICTFGGEALVSLDGHESFLHLLPLEDASRIRPDYDDLLLTSEEISDALERVEARLEDAGVTLEPLCPLPEDFKYEVTADLPPGFLDWEPDSLVETYTIYRLILTRLLRVLEEENLVFCCSA